MYKVFINDNAIIFTNNPKKDLNGVDWDKKQLLNWIHKAVADKKSKKQITIQDKDYGLFNKLKKELKCIDAGGGIVVSDKRYLAIKRNGIWDLPKGKLEKGEDIESCAIREVKEECGLDFVEIIKDLGVSCHIYKQKQTLIFKTSHWYLMRYKGDVEAVKPQQEEGIEKVKWFKKSVFQNKMKDSYASICDLLDHSLLDGL